jgi:arsenite methyltransferase
MAEPNNIAQAVKEKYGEAASRVSSGGVASCGSSPSSACCGGDPITSNLYQPEQTAGIPEQAVLASLGCGNPTALAQSKPGETVLDLGLVAASMFRCPQNASAPVVRLMA